MWKCNNEEDYPIAVKRNTEKERDIRPSTKNWMVEGGKSIVLRQCFTRDAARIWNRSSEEIKNAKTLMGAKKEIKRFCIVKDTLELTILFYF